MAPPVRQPMMTTHKGTGSLITDVRTLAIVYNIDVNDPRVSAFLDIIQEQLDIKTSLIEKLREARCTLP